MSKLIRSQALRFLGSMQLAVTLLSAVAIASVIGTILQQNQPYQDYIIKFGPFWHQVYLSLGLYDVYSSLWFMCLLAFLITSTSLCLIQNGPAILRSARDYREHLHGKVLATMPLNREWYRYVPAEAVKPQLQALLGKHGYRLRTSVTEQRTLIAAKKGSVNRLGYICTHLAVVVICIGGLIDGNIPMKLQSLTGALEVETRDLPASQIPAASRVGPGNPSFRGSITIPEGASADFAFIGLGAGYVMQELPFEIRLKEFRIEHYVTGQPKSFESDLVIHDPENDKTIEQTIAVNHPLRYRGYNIYQSSFEDGGSSVDLKLHPLTDETPEDLTVSARIDDTVKVTTPTQTLRLELEDFRRHNIVRQTASVKKQQNFRDNGPSLTFKLRRPDGSAREYVNYMLPVSVDGRDYLLSGTRAEPSEAFRYLYIPVDDSGGPQRFLRLLHLLHDDERLEATITRDAAATAARLNTAAADLDSRISGAMLQVLRLFRDGGYGAVANHIRQTVPDDQRELAGQAYIRLLHNALQTLYIEVLATEGVTVTADDLSESQSQFLDDSIEALGAIPRYGAPFYVEMTEFEQRQASGLQIARSPGKLLVYPGFLLLLAGIFLLFYIPQRRIWIELTTTDDNRLRILMAGEANRLQTEFDKEFHELATRARELPDGHA